MQLAETQEAAQIDKVAFPQRFRGISMPHTSHYRTLLL